MGRISAQANIRGPFATSVEESSVQTLCTGSFGKLSAQTLHKKPHCQQLTYLTIKKNEHRHNEDSEEGSGEGFGRLWCRARSGSTGFRKKVWEVLVQSQVRFNRVPEKSPEKVSEALVQPGQAQQGSREGSSTWFGKTLRLLGIPPKLIF